MHCVCLLSIGNISKDAIFLYFFCILKYFVKFSIIICEHKKFHLHILSIISHSIVNIFLLYFVLAANGFLIHTNSVITSSMPNRLLRDQPKLLCALNMRKNVSIARVNIHSFDSFSFTRSAADGHRKANELVEENCRCCQHRSQKRQNASCEFFGAIGSTPNIVSRPVRLQTYEVSQ